MSCAIIRIPWLGEWSLAVEQHHEKYDGTGYPRGLAGEQISYAARIVAVADSYDAITAARSYKEPISAHTARQELARSAGTHFDPIIVRAFMSISLGKVRWAIGPASWFAQIPFIGGLERIGRDLAILGLALLTLVGAIRAGFVDTPGAIASSPVVTTLGDGDGPGAPGANGSDPGGPAPTTPASTTSSSRSTTTSTTSTTTTPTSTTTSTTMATTTTTTTVPTPPVATPSSSTTTTTTVPPLRPPVAGDDAVTTLEDVDVTISVLTNDADPDGDTLVISGYDDRSAFGGDIVCGATTCTYSPAINFNGSDTFRYTVSDQRGGLDTGTVTVGVTPVNDAPVARADAATTSVDTSVIIYVLTNDSDPEGQQRSITAFDATAARGGTVACDAVCIYTPPGGFTGTDTFTYTVTDPAGLTSTATVTITVN